MVTKFGIPFSGAANEEIGGRDAARKGDPWPADQVDESRKGAMRGAPKYAADCDCVMMQSTVTVPEGFTGWKKMEPM